MLVVDWPTAIPQNVHGLEVAVHAVPAMDVRQAGQHLGADAEKLGLHEAASFDFEQIP